MNVITTLKEKRKEKQIKYERTVLKDISIGNMKKRVQEFFAEDRTLGVAFSQVLEEGCFDVAVEAYLLGAHFSKFGYYGEPIEAVKYRCLSQEKHLIDTLFNFILYWGKVGENDLYNESLYYRCEGFVETWWKEGYENGQRRYKMRLH
ncbi:DUF2521 domain-containing protein [Bacillus sp. M6-12]|uniref:YbaK family protein n=1 Tax=Bacillus sp. M6-12 TaxID=2054166 RepID=UPI000C75A2DA|nr:YbaK family protein [Bacillus sp. M6-12]PLS15576.1 DUF2521 domain-containing protein [Bacillus sp. M6-12]